MSSSTHRVRFHSGHVGHDEFRLFIEWHKALRHPAYGHVGSLEPWLVVDNQTYQFTQDSIEFRWLDLVLEAGLAEAARDLGGMIVEARDENGEWKEVAPRKNRREGILDVISEERREREDKG